MTLFNSHKTEDITISEDLLHLLENFDKTKMEYSKSLSGTENEFKCTVCDLSFNSTEPYNSHLNSQGHRDRLCKDKILPDFENGDSDDSIASEDAFYCEVCSKTMHGSISYLTHNKGKVHAKNVKKKAIAEKLRGMPGIFPETTGTDDLVKLFAECSVCKKNFLDSGSYDKHVNSAAHKKKIKSRELQNFLKTGGKENGDEVVRPSESVDEDETYTRCEICDKSFSGVTPYLIHMNSAAHQKGLQNQQLKIKIKEFCSNEDFENGFTCKECSKVFNSPAAFNTHIENNSHEKQKKKKQMQEFLSAYPELVLVERSKEYPLESDKQNGDQDEVFFICKLCCYSFTGPESARDHARSKKHLSKKKTQEMKKLLKKTTDEEAVASPGKPAAETESVGNKTENKVSNGEVAKSDEGFEFV